MPAQQRQPRREWANQRIPKAQFFDIDLVSRRDTTLPHMLPTEADFAIVASELGISHDCPVVVYDTAGLFSAARVLFTLRCFGHTQSYILSGGLPKWSSEGKLLESSNPGATLPIPREDWKLNVNEIRTLEQVLDVVNSTQARDRDDLLVDARSTGRFSGADPEPRPGLPSGHIPGSRNVPFDKLLTTSASGFKELLPPEMLRSVFEDAGVPINRAGPIVVSCGSGITACVLWLALRQAGRSNSVALYDGSWVEYGASPLAVIAKGAA